MIWNDLVRVALIGTDSARLSDETIRKLSKIGIETDEEPSRVLLEAAAYFSSLQKVGNASETWTGEHPSSKKSSFDLEPFSAKSSEHFRLLFQDNYIDALPEFIDLMIEYKKVVSGEFLPDLFDECLQSEQLWASVKQVVSPNGFWLMEQNSEWQRLSDNIETVDWYNSTMPEKLILLHSLRRSEPGRAVDLIRSTWTEDDYLLRRSYLKTFQTGISPADEEFLEKCLDDKRKEIRTTAAKLLRQLPNSALQKRILTQLKQHLNLKGNNPDIQLPASLSDEQIRDGLMPKFKFFSSGLKASRLGQMIAIVPPTQLEIHLKKSANEIIGIFTRSDWKELFLIAVSESVILHKDENWAVEILKFWIAEQELDLWDEIDVFTMINVLSEKSFNTLCLSTIKPFKTLPEDDDAISFLLKYGEQKWSDELAMYYIRLLQKWMSGQTAEYWGGWHAKNILKKGAFKIDPQLIPRLRKSWPVDAHLWPNWEEDIRSFFKILNFRKEMKEALKE